MRDPRERDVSLDVAKGLGIAFVVGGHSHIELLGINFYGFHMPLFLFISGYLFSPKPFSRFFAAKGRSLLVPLYAYIFIYSIVYAISVKAGMYPGETHPWLYTVLIDPFLSCHNIPFVSAMWFVGALFLSSFLFNAHLNIFGSRTWLNAILGVGLILALVHYPPGVYLGAYVARTFIAFAWLCLGHAFRKMESALAPGQWLGLMTIVFTICSLYAVSPGFTMVWNEYHGASYSPLFFGVSGSVLTILLAKQIRGRAQTLFASLGRESLHIMANHLFVFFLVSLALSALLGDRSWFENVFSYPAQQMVFIYFCCGLLIPWYVATRLRILSGPGTMEA